ncbi:hypothetical protein BG011_008337 [Mortierella polycephala]|uniref:Uncharacterized protein n=1 Tax=Mortierella polycephala TaxID=41804 RepID=A0A9P6PRA1_9FUNG|nr:hypothetical protein BG011_008337 [Mortierella polycephala]
MEEVAPECPLIENALEQMSISSASTASNDSQLSLEMSNDQMLGHLDREKERFATRKTHAAGLLVVSSPMQQLNNEAVYDKAERQLEMINVKIKAPTGGETI